MIQPLGFEDPQYPDRVCKLNKAIYGLKQAPRAWFDKLSTVLVGFGFVSAKADHSLFIKLTAAIVLYVLVYVDDILITGSDDNAISTFVSALNKAFALKDLGTLSYFLGIKAIHHDTGILLSQQKYIQDLLCKAQLQGVKTQNSPMNGGLRLSHYGSDPVEDPTQYRSIVGALQFACITRPDIAFSVNKVFQFMHNPLQSHWVAVKRILRYLAGTLDYGLQLNRVSSLHIQAYCDADWAVDPDDRRSTTGYCVFISENLVSWQSKKQKTISRSSIEAEFRSMAVVVFEITWIQSLMSELHMNSSLTPSVWCDNLSSIMLAANPVLHARTKHIEIDLYFVRDKVLNKEISVSHVPSEHQIVDCLTKQMG